MAVEPHHVGVDAGFIDKNQAGGVKQALLADPLAARPRHVLAFLFGGQQALLLAGDFMTSQEAIQRALEAIGETDDIDTGTLQQ